MDYTATYSPEDNKLRLYASARLDAETYARVKAAGFSWAPKQDLFVAPMWTPEREDLLEELAGEIEDEDKSLVDRAGFLKQTAVPVTIRNLEAHDVKIRLMGDFAIIHARTSYTMPDGQQAFGRYTDVWARQNGRWLAVSAHVSR